MTENKPHKNTSMWREIDGLRQQTVGELRVKYLKVFGLASRSNHKEFLVRRIAWRLQANAEGGLTERALERAAALADENDLRICGPQSFIAELSKPPEERGRDPRLPAPGTVLRRTFQGHTISVEVLAKGFRYEGQVYKSLSAVARHITGVQWNGFAFFAVAGVAEPRHG